MIRKSLLIASLACLAIYSTQKSAKRHIAESRGFHVVPNYNSR